MINSDIKHIIILGGGTAGWITAGILAAQHIAEGHPESIKISLIEDTSIPPIGVGEGTWPSMRETLKMMGIDEGEFLKQCDASFKQGSKFIGWLNGEGEHYYHPFSLPESFYEVNLANHWLTFRDKVSFTDAVTFQVKICELGLAPKQISTPAYSFFANYGYHLDAGKFGAFIRQHCVNHLGVTHIDDKVIDVHLGDDDYIDSVSTRSNGNLKGDLFIDCTGTHGLLLDKTYAIPFISKKHIIPNDRAIAVQVPYQSNNSPIASMTHSTAHGNGWVWDIGLQSRKGIGIVYSSAHADEDTAEKQLIDYVETNCEGVEVDNLVTRKLSFNPGHRQKFWHKNAVAVGMSAGFVEPLEASAIALIELSAKYISQQLPSDRDSMTLVANRFNKKFSQRWEQIMEFLKLHYVLSNRNDTDYWCDHKDESSIPDTLAEKLALWKRQTPYTHDSFVNEELFPSASNQFVYYGMQGETQLAFSNRYLTEQPRVDQILRENQQKSQQIVKSLPSNRELLDKIKQYGLRQI